MTENETDLAAQITRLEKALTSEREHSRKWEKRAKTCTAEHADLFGRAETWRKRAQNNAAQRDAYRLDSEKWHTRAVANLAVIQAHEKTINRFINKLDDVLTED